MYACMIVYNDAVSLRLSMLSILPYVKKIIVVDGAYASYPYGKHPESTDGTRKIARQVGGKKLIWVGCPRKGKKYIPWAGQCAKRSAYLRKVPDGEWFIVWDADEIIVGEVKREFKKLEASNWHYASLPELCFYPLAKGCKINWYPNDALMNIPKSLWTHSKLPWVAVWSPKGRWGIYKKEASMRYAKHHSNIWVTYNGKPMLIWDKYGRGVYKLQGVKVLNLKCLQSWEKYHKGIVYRVNRPDPEP